MTISQRDTNVSGVPAHIERNEQAPTATPWNARPGVRRDESDEAYRRGVAEQARIDIAAGR